ncbi:MAG TPA: tRNA pseudouridine(38-40) synthase TruA [Vicinamibacterales bacterium]|jgi:tRNA pseudouridine38-40 synthase
MRLKLTIEYAGTRYSGWQIQKNAKTIQGEIERAIEAATDQRDFELYGSGRTDAGVHALAQVAHLEIRSTMPPEILRRKVNDELPADINLLRAEKVRHSFHARHDAIGRTYLYQVSRRRTAFAKAFVWWVREDLDLARMRQVAARFVGFHDFRSFSDSDPHEGSTEVLLDALDIREEGDLVVFRVDGSHFIWKLVRRLVGVLVEVGRGGLEADAAVALLTTPSDVPARVTAPASGLFLAMVRYKGDASHALVTPAMMVPRA